MQSRSRLFFAVARHTLIGLAMLTAAGTAQAAFFFRATLTHDQEVISPPIPDEGSGGTAIFVLNDAQTQLTYDVQLFGLDMSFVADSGLTPAAGDLPPGVGSNILLRMHIHRNIAGVNGPIVFGMIDQSVLLLNDNEVVIDQGALHVTGTWDFDEGAAAAGATLLTELDELFSGGLYINVHTNDHAGGEIRGQILQVPAPGSLALLGLGLLGIAGLRRRSA